MKDKKVKIIIAFISIPIIIFLIYYINTKNDQIIISSNIIEENEVNGENEKKETKEEIENIIVHVSGCVNKEGIVELPINSRVIDAINYAGGVKENADLSEINLASILEDGIKIYIPSLQEKTENALNQNNELNISSKINENISSNSTQKININTATQEQLDTLPGIGQSTALKIIEYRKENGKFKKIKDIKQVKGIGEAKFNKLKDLITCY